MIKNFSRFSFETCDAHRLFLLLRIIQCDISTFSGPNTHGILDRDYKDSSISDFTRMCSLQYGLNGLFGILVANHDRDHDPFDRTGIVHHSPIDSGLTRLSDSSRIVIREPFDVGFEKRLFHLLEFRLPDNRFNLFISLVFLS